MSEELELRLKRRIQIIVVAAMSLFFVLVTVATLTLAVRVHQEAQIRALDRHNAALSQQIEEAKRDTEFFKTPEFKYGEAIRNHNSGRPGDIIVL